MRRFEIYADGKLRELRGEGMEWSDGSFHLKVARGCGLTVGHNGADMNEAQAWLSKHDEQHAAGLALEPTPAKEKT